MLSWIYKLLRKEIIHNLGLKKIGACSIHSFQKYKLSFPVPEQLYVILVIKMFYIIIYLIMEVNWMNRNIWGLQVIFLDTQDLMSALQK